MYCRKTVASPGDAQGSDLDGQRFQLGPTTPMDANGYYQTDVISNDKKSLKDVPAAAA
jgi:hypothetical protein